MQMITCPFCDARVIRMESGLCPNCRGDIAGGHPRVDETACFKCGGATEPDQQAVVHLGGISDVQTGLAHDGYVHTGKFHPGRRQEEYLCTWCFLRATAWDSRFVVGMIAVPPLLWGAFWLLAPLIRSMGDLVVMVAYVLALAVFMFGLIVVLSGVVRLICILISLFTANGRDNALRAILRSGGTTGAILTRSELKSGSFPAG